MTFRWMEKRVIDVFSRAGIVLDSSDPWSIELVKPDEFFRAVALRGHDGFADAYWKGYWECKAIDQCVFKLLSSGVVDGFKFRPANLRLFLSDLFLNKQRPERAKRSIEHHYDLGPVFRTMLDRTRSYSCGYWAKATNLESAQLAKIDIVCRKLGLQKGMTFCDIGCGWGGLISQAAQHYGCKSHGLTLSTDQRAYINTLTHLNIPPGASLSVELLDYRDLRGRYDRIASVGMFEHVGPKNYRKFMRCIDEHLHDDGLFLLHTIGACDPTPTLNRPGLSWIEKNIFPNAALPSMGQICAAADGRFKLLDVENIGKYYDPTLMAWAKNFENGWESIQEEHDERNKGKAKIGEEFRRMWCYYLYSCAASFRAGGLDVWQIVFAKRNWSGSYKAIRPRFVTLESV